MVRLCFVVWGAIVMLTLAACILGMLGLQIVLLFPLL